MKPRLAVIIGPSKDSVYALGEEDFSIGRELSNRLSIADRLLSRRHCLIRRDEDGRFRIQDLDSSNGTYVNGVPAKERLLEHGDQISVGDSRFVFLLDEGDAAPPANSVHLDERNYVARTTIRLRAEDVPYLRPETVLSSLPPLAQMARDLAVLLKVSTTINSLRETEALERRLLELIFEFVPAERGAILLGGDRKDDGGGDVDDDGGDAEIISVFGLDRASVGLDHAGSGSRPVEVSRTIAAQVLREGVSILSNDVRESEEFASAASLISAHISSLLCVPLLLYGRALGVVYLMTTDPSTRFNEDHLQLLTVIAGIAAVALENARHMERLAGENERLRSDIQVEHNMVGESRPMSDVYQFIGKVAPTSSTVLIRGESGTGKELAARAIHLNSPRAAKPFVAINCAALTETLLESELFGHERGAFTGALAQKKGKLEVADGGTLLLDEVGEMSPVLQVKLLRVLQEREFERVGGTRTIKVDVRVVAATNRDLEQAVASGDFRQDLYYRLNVVSFEMPALRERREDIPLLANYFAGKYGNKFNRRISGISPEARNLLLNYDWPGNVRELENAIERAVVLGSTERLLPEDLPENILEAEQPSGTTTSATRYHEAVKEAKKQLILKAIESANGNYTEAARLLGVHPNYLHRLVRNLNLRAALKK